MRADVMGKLVLRPYTIAELDQMRDALRVLCRAKPVANGGTFTPDPSKVEDQLRTHMINGTDPVDLIAAAAVRAVDNGVAMKQQLVDRWRNELINPDPRSQKTVGERLMKLRRAVVELERYKTLNGR